MGPAGKASSVLMNGTPMRTLILLCPTHHTLIDKVEADFPIARLYQLKIDHELWVREKLSTEEAKEELDRLIYSHLIDEVVRIADFAN